MPNSLSSFLSLNHSHCASTYCSCIDGCFQQQRLCLHLFSVSKKTASNLLDSLVLCIQSLCRKYRSLSLGGPYTLGVQDRQYHDEVLGLDTIYNNFTVDITTKAIRIMREGGFTVCSKYGFGKVLL